MSVRLWVRKNVAKTGELKSERGIHKISSCFKHEKKIPRRKYENPNAEEAFQLKHLRTFWAGKVKIKEWPFRGHFNRCKDIFDMKKSRSGGKQVLPTSKSVSIMSVSDEKHSNFSPTNHWKWKPNGKNHFQNYFSTLLGLPDLDRALFSLRLKINSNFACAKFKRRQRKPHVSL